MRGDGQVGALVPILIPVAPPVSTVPGHATFSSLSSHAYHHHLCCIQVLSPYTCDASEGYDTIAITNGLDGALGEARVLQASAALEEALAPLRAKPHWGKLFTHTPTQLEELYGGRLTLFREVVRRVDPEKKFSNSWLERMVMGQDGDGAV